MFLARRHHEELMALKNEQLADRDLRIAELEVERKKLWDVIAYTAVRIPIFNKDLIPTFEEEPELTGDAKVEAEFASEQAEIKNRLVSIQRTRPSQLGDAMAQEIAARRRQRAAAAHPPATQVAAVFQQARNEVESTQG